jgi:hypothetical protein
MQKPGTDDLSRAYSSRTNEELMFLATNIEEPATFGPNPRLVFGLAIAAAGLLCLAWLEYKPTGEWRDEFVVSFFASILLIISAVCAIAALWTAFQRVIIDSNEIISRGILGERRMRWDQICEFYHSEEVLFLFFFVNFLPVPFPVPSPQLFKLVDSQGQRLWCGPGLARRELLAIELIGRSQPHLLRSAISLFNSGMDVTFGPIRVSRLGICIKKGYRENRFPLSELYSHGFQQRQFYIWRVGREKVGMPIEKIPNVYVLDDLLKLAREGASSIPPPN